MKILVCVKQVLDPDGISVNARCIDGGNIESMQVRPFDGRDWEKARAEYRDDP